MNFLSVSLWKRFKTVYSTGPVVHYVITKRNSLSGCTHFLSELTIVQLYEAFTDQDFSSIFDRGFSLVEISKPTNYWIKHLFRTPEQYNLCWPTSCQLSLTVPIFRQYIIATQGALSKSEKKARCSKQVKEKKQGALSKSGLEKSLKNEQIRPRSVSGEQTEANWERRQNSDELRTEKIFGRVRNMMQKRSIQEREPVPSTHQGLGQSWRGLGEQARITERSNTRDDF